MRREYAGAVPKANLSVLLGGTSADLTIICADLTGWPVGTNPFFIIINRGKPTEEKILVESRTGNILTVWTDGASNGRAADGTAISSHQIGEPVEHVFTATDADEANEHVNTGSGAHGYPAISSLVTLTGTQTLTNKTLDGDNNTFTDIPQTAVTNLVSDLASKAVYPSQAGNANKVLGTNGTSVSWVDRPTDGVDGIDGSGIAYQPTAPVAPLDGDVWVDSDNIIPTPGYIPPGGSSGQILAKATGDDYDAEWIAASSGSLAGLSDVVIGTPADNDSLTWDAGTSKWVPQAITGGGGSSSVAYQPSAPSSPSIGDVWVDSDGVMPEAALPTGGSAGQVLTKATGADYDVAWQSGAGLVLIAAQSFTSASTVSVNNCFTSTYDNYRIVLTITSSTDAAYTQLRYRVGGTDDSTTNYLQQNVDFGSTTVAASRATADAFHRVAYHNTSVPGVVCEIDVFRPAQATPTIGLSWSPYRDTAATNLFLRYHGHFHNVSTAYDGFTLYPAAGSFTGSLCVYGYRKAL